MKILIYRERIGIPDFPESFSEFAIDNYQVELITISDFDRKESIDQELSELVSKGREETPDILVIPSVLGTPLSFYGVRLAMHWRLNETIDNLNKIPIILLGDEDEASFFRHCGYSTFLKSPNVYYAHFNEYSVTNLIMSGSVKQNDFDLNSTLEYYNVNAPASYKSYHSVTNEWCILRWANALKINDDIINSIRKTIGNSLYYKLLSCRFPISNVDEIRQKNLHNKGKIMLIDDEIDKGWKSIFSTICLNQIFIPIGDNFKGMETSEEIVKFSMEKVKSEFPDVIILDLRLSDNDFTDNLPPTELTGYKILKEIKGYNSGIQVIVMSATNKIWNLLELQKIDADGFIMKESPELSIDKDFTKNNLNFLFSSIDSCIDYSFLKDLFKTYYELEVNIKHKIKSRLLPDYFGVEILKWLKFSIKNIQQYKSEESLTTSFLMLFSVVENISNRIIDVDNPIPTYEDFQGKPLYYFEFRSESRKIHFFEETFKGSGEYRPTERAKFLLPIPWFIKILNTFEFLFDFNPDISQINNLIKKRNTIIHANATTGEVIKIEKLEVIYLFNLICNSCKNIT